jgi:hypothetical protein
MLAAIDVRRQWLGVATNWRGMVAEGHLVLHHAAVALSPPNTHPAIATGPLARTARGAVCLTHGLVGLAAVATGGIQLVAAANGRGDGLMNAAEHATWIRVCLGLIVLGPGLVVVFSAFPMWGEGHRAYRSAAVAGFVLAVAVFGPWLLFGGRWTLGLAVALLIDLMMLGGFALRRVMVRGRP